MVYKKDDLLTVLLDKAIGNRKEEIESFLAKIQGHRKNPFAQNVERRALRRRNPKQPNWLKNAIRRGSWVVGKTRRLKQSKYNSWQGFFRIKLKFSLRFYSPFVNKDASCNYCSYDYYRIKKNIFI